MKRRLGALLATLLVLVAGCSDAPERDSDDDVGGGDGGDGNGDDAPQCTPGFDGCPCPEDSEPIEGGGCRNIDSMWYDVQVTGSGAFEVGVPLPHGQWCLTPEDWLGNMQSTRNVTHHEARDVDRGKVLWLQARDDAQFLARVDVTNRTTCNTFRADPWSIDPDPAEDQLDIQSASAVQVTIYVRHVRGGCADLQQFQGPAQGGWTPVPRVFNNTSCA